MVSAVTLSLFRKTFKAKRKNPRQINKKWHDKDCPKLLRDVTSAKYAFNRNSTDASFRIRYYKKFKEYKRSTKLKKRIYKDKLTNILNDAIDKDPQTASKIINELKKNSVPTDKIEFTNEMNGITIFVIYYNLTVIILTKTEKNKLFPSFINLRN